MLNVVKSKGHATRGPIMLGLCLLILAGGLLAGCEEEQNLVPVSERARPVSFMTLETSDPSRLARVTGSAESWKKELIGFRVNGRVRYVLDPGTEITGTIEDEEGNVLEPGTIIAELDNDRYKLRLDEAQARLETAKARAQVVRTEAEKTIPARLVEAEATNEKNRREFARQQNIFEKGAGARSFLEQAEAAFKESEARLGQIRADLDAKKAELQSFEAAVREAEQLVNQAEVDLADTQLFSPFDGQVSKVHVIPGGYVERGQPVATVQLMDPMKVEIAVSPEVDRQINYNDLLRVYLDDSEEPSQGWVYLKASVADAATRTFMITLFVRNDRIEVDLPEEVKGKEIVRTPDLFQLEPGKASRAGAYFAEVSSIYEDEQGSYVWKVEGLSIPDMAGEYEPVFTVKKLRVTPGDRYIRYLDIFTFRELADIGKLDPDKDLVAGRLPDTVKEGDTVVLSREQWKIRPGQLVRVDLRKEQMPPGFYVPVQAIQKDSDGYHVITVREVSPTEERAQRVAVEPGTTFGSLQAIEAATDGELAEGTKVVIDGVHFLRDGDRINAFDEVEPTS